MTLNISYVTSCYWFYRQNSS